MQVLEAAANVTRSETSFEMMDYIVSLAEGIMDAWGGIILALKSAKGSSTAHESRVPALIYSS